MHDRFWEKRTLRSIVDQKLDLPCIKKGVFMRALPIAILALLWGASLPGSAVQAQQTARTTSSVSGEDGNPVVMARSKQYDITSRINGRSYRIMVSTPLNADPSVAYPVMYVLDGNNYFATATSTLAGQARTGIAAPAIVVAIGYPSDDSAVWTRRRFLDLTRSVSDAPDQAPTGGSTGFLRFIEEEVKPFVVARYKVDATRQILYGYSLGGMTVLGSLLRNPGAFSTYIVASPSIWWDNKIVLADEAVFSTRAHAGELHMKILITSAGDEQYRGTDPKQLASDHRMVDNASDLAARLAALDPARIVVARAIFDGEVHASAPPATLSRASRFALPLPGAQSH
jgi:predicted alpha/beta superfamily hydrolase